MSCLALPVSMLKRCYTGNSRLGYRQLNGDGPVTVVVGKEKREFLVDPFVLEESPFRYLLEAVKKDDGVAMRRSYSYDLKYDRHRGGGRGGDGEGVIFVDVDAILFEHMLWLLYNDCSSLFSLNLEEVIDFYALDY